MYIPTDHKDPFELCLFHSFIHSSIEWRLAQELDSLLSNRPMESFYNCTLKPGK